LQCNARWQIRKKEKKQGLPNFLLRKVNCFSFRKLKVFPRPSSQSLSPSLHGFSLRFSSLAGNGVPALAPPSSRSLQQTHLAPPVSRLDEMRVSSVRIDLHKQLHVGRRPSGRSTPVLRRRRRRLLRPGRILREDQALQPCLGRFSRVLFLLRSWAELPVVQEELKLRS